MSTVKYPDGFKEENKLYFLYRLEQYLRQQHNLKGRQYNNGNITKNQWNDYLTNVYRPKRKAITTAFSMAKENARIGTLWVTDTSKDFV